MILAISLNEVATLANQSLMVVSAALGLSAGVVFWWFMLKD